MTKNASAALHLFSSDYRPLYVQDCLDLLSKPRGAVQRFRYRSNQVSPSPTARGDLRQSWQDLATSETEVLVYFVTIRDPVPSESVYVPLRRGRVVSTFVEGDYFFVDFSVEEYLDPFSYRPSENLGSVDLESSESRIERLKSLSSGIRKLLGGRFPSGLYPDGSIGQFSAVIGARPAQDGTANGTKAEGAAFNHAARALGDLLVPRGAIAPPDAAVVAPTSDTVAPPTADTFVRIVGLRRLTKSGATARFGPKTGQPRVKLRSGSQYALDVFQFSSRPGFVELAVDLPTAVIPVTTNKVTLSTPYDVATFEFFAEARDNPTVGEIRLRVKRDPDVPRGSDEEEVGSDPVGQAPNVLPDARFAVRIVPRRTFTGLSWVVAIGTTIAAFIVTLASLDGVFITPPSNQTDVLDLTWLVQWTGISGAYLGVDASALIVAAIAGVGTGAAALAALWRRRFGLSS